MKATIECSRIVHYTKEIEVSEQMHEELTMAPTDISESKSSELFHFLESTLNEYDVTDADAEFSSFQIYTSKFE